MNKFDDKFKLLILADDLTGALDSGVQLVSKGLKVIVYTYPQKIKNLDFDVLVINTESRHESSKNAFEIVYKLTKEALEKGFTYFYKKTDSGLRGNVGAELEAMLKATQSDYLHFVPAYPKMNRVTKNGIHYVNGKLLEDSIFANDPTNPIRTSIVKEIIHSQSDVHVSCLREKGIVVHDCESEQQLSKIVTDLQINNDLRVCAGCAGLLEVYPFQNNTKASLDFHNTGTEMIIVSGSANLVTLEQLDEANKNGAFRVHVPIDEIKNDEWEDNKKIDFIHEVISKAETTVIFDTNSKMDSEITKDDSNKISTAIGKVAAIIARDYPDKTLMLIGGDALYSFIKELDIKELEPYFEIYSGTVLAKYRFEKSDKLIITKSGAFGDKNIIKNIQNFLKGEK